MCLPVRPNRYGVAVQDVVLALLAKEPSHGYELRARLQAAVGGVGPALSPLP